MGLKILKTDSKNAGYSVVENFEPYIGNENSVCMEKKL